MRYSDEEKENIREFLQENKDLINAGRFREVFENMLDPDSRLMLLEIFLKSGIRPFKVKSDISNEALISIADHLIDDFDYREQGLFASEIAKTINLRIIEDVAKMANWLGYTTYAWYKDSSILRDFLITIDNLNLDRLLRDLNKRNSIIFNKDDFNRIELW